MHHDKAVLGGKIKNFCIKQSISYSDDQINKITEYIGLLLKWKKVYNLTALGSVDDVLVKHIFDSLLLVKYLQQLIEKTGKKIPCHILDIGTGAGLPAVVLSIFLVDCKIDCVDLVLKKITFINQVKIQLKITNLNPYHINALELSGTYDFIVARAVASVNNILDFSNHLAHPDTCWLFMKGKNPLDEITEAKANHGNYSFHVEHLSPIAATAADRCIVLIKSK